MGGDSAIVAYPLFQKEDGGASPTSPLQFNIYEISLKRAIKYNEEWHSRLPKVTSTNGNEICFGAEFNGKIYACAIWANPSARMFNGKNYLELRRMAICIDAPKNTASRMISIMTKIIKKSKPNIVKLISYQDTEVHSGTIYKASGWKAIGFRKGDDWSCNTRSYKQKKTQSPGDKIRWEKDLI
jgi:hypothetical protein